MGVGDGVAEDASDGVGNGADEVVVVVLSRTAAKSENESDVSDTFQWPPVHPPRMIEPSGRTVTSLKSSSNVVPA